MASEQEELRRSIERTRDELARTVGVIAERLDPKRAAGRGIGRLRAGVTGAVGGAKAARVPKPVIGAGLAALLAFAAILAARRTGRGDADGE